MLPRFSLFLLGLLAPTLAAQTASYTTFGAGCRGSGSGGPGCMSANWNHMSRRTIGSSANFAILANTGPSARVVCGLELFIATRQAQPVTMNVWLYDRDATTKQPGKILASSRMQVGTTIAACRATIAPPIVLQANTDFFVAFDNTVSLYLPIAPSGTNEIHYWNGPPNWSGPFNSGLAWSYNILCCGQSGAVPQIGNSGVPKLNTTFSITLANAKPSAPAAMSFGASKTNWGPFRLPLDLSAAGAPGCSVLASLELLLPKATDTGGKASIPLGIPNATALLGVVFHSQWLISDQANALGWVLSNGGSGTVGN